MKIKILFICSEYPPTLHGGLGAFVKNLAEKLTPNGFECFVIGLYENGSNQLVKENGVYIKRLRKCNPGLLNKLLLSRLIIETIRKITFSFRVFLFVKHHKIDIMESYEWTGPLAFSPGINLIVRLHGSNSAYSELEGIKKSHFIYFYEKLNVNMADYVVSVSNEMLTLSSITFGAIKVNKRVIYNSYNDQIFQYHGENNRNKNKILFVGKFLDRKGVCELFKILNLLLKINKNYTFEFVGAHDEQQKEFLLTLIDLNEQNQIVFTKNIPHVELVKKYHEAMLLLVPSKAEAFGLIVLEAKACGCVVAMNKIGVASELINNGETGIIFENSNIVEGAQILAHYLKNQNLIEKIRIKALEQVCSKFSSDVILNQNILLYKEIYNEI